MVICVAIRMAAQRRKSRNNDGDEERPLPSAPKHTSESVKTKYLWFQHFEERARWRPKFTRVLSSRTFWCSLRSHLDLKSSLQRSC